MSVKQFTRVNIGAVGIQPGDLRLVTTDDLVTISQPGYINNVAPLWGINVEQGDLIKILYGSSLDLFIQMVPQFSGTVITLVPTAAGGGSVDSAANVGTGEGVFKTQVLNQLQFKTLVAGTNMAITPTGADELTFDSTSGGGDITDGQNLGGGDHIFAQKSGSLLQFKTALAGTGIDITSTATTFTIANTATSGDITNGLNLGGGEHVFAQKNLDILEFKTILAGAGIGLSSNASTLTITNTGGGGGAFQYDNAMWVASNGNDANNGKSIDEPKLTVQAAITALAGNGVIHIEDSGSYAGAWNISAGSDITIDAPGAFLNTTGVTLGAGCIFKVNSYSFGTNFNNLFPGNASGRYIAINSEKVRGNVGDGVNNPGQLFINAQEITGDYTFAQNLSAIMNFETIAGDIIDTSPGIGPPTIGIFARNISGNISSVNNKIYGDVVSTSVGSTISGIGFGNFNDTIDTVGGGFSTAVFIGGDLTVQSQSVRTAVAGSLTNWALAKGGALVDGYIFQMEDSGKLFTYGGNPNITVFGPSDATVPWLPAGWFVYIQQDDFSGRVIVDADPTGSGGSIISSGGANGTQGRGSIVSLNIIRGQSDSSVRIYGLSGQTNSSFSTVNVFISQIDGNDALADGSLSNQFATIGAAFAYVIATYTATPSHGINLIITDDAIYDEQIDFTGTVGINLIGREAQMDYSGVGDTITADSTIFIALGRLAASGGGNALVYNSVGPTDALIGNIDSITSGAVINNGTAIILLQSFALLTQHTITGGGQILYSALYRAGSGSLDGAGVKGISPQFVQGDFAVNGVLNINGNFSFPSVDGTNGQTLQTDGAGTVTWQPPPFVGMPYTTIAGTSQAAAVSNGYVIGNAAQTTVTLPATAAVGSKVAIMGLGAGGWVTQANGGQTLQVGIQSSSVGGTATSAAASDSVTWVCIVADTLWSSEAPVSAGLILA